MLNNKMVGYAHAEKVFGAIGAVNYIENTVTLVTKDKNLHTVDLDGTTVSEYIGVINGKHIFDHDVLSGKDFGNNDATYEIELVEGGIQFHKLDSKLNREKSGVVIPMSDFSKLPKNLNLVGNIFELKDKLPQVDFNIKIVKDLDQGGYTYFYACNNKELEQVDLIKVIYMGHQLLKEEDYKRVSLSYEVYQDSVEAGTLKEVSPQELLNYVTGKTYGYSEPDVEGYVEEEEYEEDYYDYEDEEEYEPCDCPACRPDEDEVEDYCEECEEHVDDCQCDLW